MFHRRKLLLSAGLAVTKFVALTQRDRHARRVRCQGHDFRRAHAAMLALIPFRKFVVLRSSRGVPDLGFALFHMIR